jgi:hypothetical protein
LLRGSLLERVVRQGIDVCVEICKLERIVDFGERR